MGRDVFYRKIRTPSKVVMKKEMMEEIESNYSTDQYAGDMCGINELDEVPTETIFGSAQEAEEYLDKRFGLHTGSAIPVRVVVPEKKPNITEKTAKKPAVLSEEQRKKIWSKWEDKTKKFEEAYLKRKELLKTERENARKEKIADLRKQYDAYSQKVKDAEAKNAEAQRIFIKALKEYEDKKAASFSAVSTGILPEGENTTTQTQKQQQQNADKKPRAPRALDVVAPAVKCPNSSKCSGAIPLLWMFSPSSSYYRPDTISNEKCPFCRADLVGADTAKIKTLEEQVEKDKKALFEASKATPDNVYFYVRCVALS